jgi:hypothetical protein
MAEKWVPMPGHPGGGFRKDLFGFIDIIALDPGRGVTAIQSCGQSFSSHLEKIMDSECTEYVIEWLKHGKCECGKQLTHLELWSWRKVKVKRGGKAMRWSPRVQEITLEDFEHEDKKTPQQQGLPSDQEG